MQAMSTKIGSLWEHRATKLCVSFSDKLGVWASVPTRHLLAEIIFSSGTTYNANGLWFFPEYKLLVADLANIFCVFGWLCPPNSMQKSLGRAAKLPIITFRVLSIQRKIGRIQTFIC